MKESEDLAATKNKYELKAATKSLQAAIIVLQSLASGSFLLF